MNLLRRAAPVQQPRRQSAQTRALMVNGKYQTIAELRSSYGNGMRIVSNGSGIVTGDYSPEELANAYKTGLTTFIGINTRCGISAEIPVRCIDCYGEVVDGGPAEMFIKNAPKFIWRMLAHSIIWGEIYIAKVKNRHGYFAGLEILSPLDVEPEMDYSRGTVRRYRVMRTNGVVSYYDPCDMIIDLTFNPFSDIDGTGALEPAKVRNDIETNIGRYGAMFFANSARPDLIITTENEMSTEEAQAAKKSYADSFKGVLNSFRVWFAGGDKYTVTPTSINPVDLAMVDLANQADMKILAAIRVSPILAGLGTASDPLSAQSTYEQVRRQQVDFVAIPDVRMICNILNEQWLHCDFENGADRYRLEPDIAGITSDSLGTGERVTTAGLAVDKHLWSINEGRKYTGKEPLKFAVPINPDWAISMYNAGLFKDREALLAVGYAPETIKADNLYIWDRDPRAKAPPAQQGGGLPFGATQSYYPQLPAQPTQRSIEAPKPTTIDIVPAQRAIASPESCFVILSLANNPAIASIQDGLKSNFPGIEWATPDSFHVTLVHSTKTTDTTSITSVLPKSINSFEFQVGPFASFDAPDKIPVILKVKAPIELIALQAGLASSFEALGLTLSDHSDPNDWQPHVTLGYADPGVALPTGDPSVTVSSSTIICSVEKGQSFQTIYVTRSAVQTNAQVEELRLWSKKVQKHGPRARFSAEAIADPVVAFVRTSLDADWSPVSVFEAAKTWVRTGEAQTIGATEQQALDFWQHYDELDAEVREGWLNNYMMPAWDSLKPHLDALNDAQVQTALSAQHSALVATWVGTLTEPGALTSLYLAGVVAGDKSLARGTGAKPHRAIVPAVNFGLVSQEALDFVRQYAFGLIKGIDDTTVEYVRKAIDDGIANGQSVDDIAKVLDGVFHDPARARLIAQSESMNAYRQGAANRWQQVGVNRAKWHTVGASACPICKRLNGQVADIATGWTDPDTGITYRYSAHPGDRCFWSPEL